MSLIESKQFFIPEVFNEHILVLILSQLNGPNDSGQKLHGL